VKMGRPSKYDWKAIRLDLEAGQENEYVHKKYDVPYDAINKHLKRNPLEVNQQAKHALKGFDEISQVISQVEDKHPELARTVLEIASERSQHIRLFANSALQNQRYANNAMKEKSTDMNTLEAHSRITQRNKDTVLGKEKSTEITNVNAQTTNNNLGISFE